jgi:hypothetical protein
MLISNPSKMYYKNEEENDKKNKFEKHSESEKIAYFHHIFASNFFF